MSKAPLKKRRHTVQFSKASGWLFADKEFGPDPIHIGTKGKDFTDKYCDRWISHESVHLALANIGEHIASTMLDWQIDANVWPAYDRSGMLLFHIYTIEIATRLRTKKQGDQ